MKILFTVTSYPPAVGGAQLHLHQLAQHLQRHGHVAQVVTHWDEQRTDWLLGTTLRAPATARTYSLDGVPVQRISLPSGVRKRIRGWVYSYFALQRWALPRIAEAIAAEVEPYVESVDLVHNCRIGREGLSYASLYLARSHGVPFVLTPFHHPRWNTWLHRHYHRLYRAASAVVALTEAERRMLVDLGVEPERIFVTGHGPLVAETSDGEGFRTRFGLRNRPIVLFIGQKYRYKGIGLLLEAAREVWKSQPETRFLFLGPRTSYSQRLFAASPDPRILELDTVTLQEKTDALAACDVFCLPSSQESFGGVFTEAWSLSKPVVGADIPSVRDVIDDGVNGFLVPLRAATLADKLVKLLNDRELATRMGQSGCAKTLERYTWPRIAQRTEEVYREVLDRAAAGAHAGRPLRKLPFSGECWWRR